MILSPTPVEKALQMFSVLLENLLLRLVEMLNAAAH